MSMQAAEQLINGLILGAMYALVASGLSLIWGSLKMLNFAHGEFYMLGGYMVFMAFTIMGMHPLIALIFTMVSVFLMGAILQHLLIRPLVDKPGWDVSHIVITLGISIFLQNFAHRVWGENFQNVPYFFNGTSTIFGLGISHQRILILVVTVLVIFLLITFLKKSRAGWALRATAQDRDAATLYGVDVQKVYMWTMGLSAALAALSAAMLAPIYSVNPWMGNAVLTKGFIVCVLGGLGSLEGAILGGILLATAESLGVLFWSSEWKDVVSFALLIIVLWIRPSGLFGTKEW